MKPPAGYPKSGFPKGCRRTIDFFREHAELLPHYWLCPMSARPIDAIVMAGGKGKRLAHTRPYCPSR